MISMTNSLPKRLKTALKLLEKHQGVKTWEGASDPLDSLMLTILSQNTNDKLRDQAYDNLRRRWPTWKKVLEAPTDELAKQIRIGGLSRQKAARMKEVLRWIKERFGKLSLDDLEGMTDDEVIELLTSQKGVGIKTAAVVLMAALGRDICPVDTHVHRIAGRLGWVPATMTAEKVFWILRPHVPQGHAYSLHMNLLQFGRTICLARNPLCGKCFLYDECEWEGKELRRKQMTDGR
jgi:endonuclease-3